MLPMWSIALTNWSACMPCLHKHDWAGLVDKPELCMIFSLNENRKSIIINEMLFNEGVVMFDKEIIFFVKWNNWR